MPLAGDPAVEAEGGVVGEHAAYDLTRERAGEAARDPPGRARRHRRPGGGRLEVHRPRPSRTSRRASTTSRAPARSSSSTRPTASSASGRDRSARRPGRARRALDGLDSGRVAQEPRRREGAATPPVEEAVRRIPNRAPGVRAESMSQAILFDRDQVEKLETLHDRPKTAERLQAALGRHRPELAPTTPSASAEEFELDSRTRECLATPNERAVFNDHGRYIVVTAYAPNGRRRRRADRARVRRRRELGDHRARGADPGARGVRLEGVRLGRRGWLDGPTFLAVLLEWVLGSYSAAFERIEQRLEEFDVQAMRGDSEAERGHRAADRDAQGGREAPARARGAPVRARRAHVPGARGARRLRVRRALPVALAPLRSRPCRRRATRARRSSAPSTS